MEMFFFFVLTILPFFSPFSRLITEFVTKVTLWVAPCGAGSVHPSRALCF